MRRDQKTPQNNRLRFKKCMVSCVHDHRVTRSSLTGLNSPSAPPTHPSPPSMLPAPLIALLCLCELSRFIHAPLFVTLLTAARQAPLSMGFSRQEHCSGLPCPPPGDLPHPGIRPVSLRSPSLASGFFITSTTWEAHRLYSFTFSRRS